MSLCDQPEEAILQQGTVRCSSCGPPPWQLRTYRTRYHTYMWLDTNKSSGFILTTIYNPFRRPVFARFRPCSHPPGTGTGATTVSNTSSTSTSASQGTTRPRFCMIQQPTYIQKMKWYGANRMYHMGDLFFGKGLPPPMPLFPPGV